MDNLSDGTVISTHRELSVSVEGELSIYEAASHRAEFLEALGQCDVLTIDLSGVTLIDGAGLQVLVMLKREALRQDKSLSLAGHGESVLKVLDLTNLAGFFGDPLVLAAPKPR